MPASIEDAVEVDGVELPTSCDGGNVFVQAGDERDMAWSRFGGNASVGDAKGAVGEDTRPDERSKRAWSERIGGVCGGR